MTPTHPAPFTASVVDDGFQPVADAFAGLLESGAEVGASVSVWRGGKPVLELHGGWQDTDRTVPWRADTLSMTYSTGKPVAALAALRAVAEGRLTLDAPAAEWWPAFGHGAKSSTTLRHILSHTAGLPAFSAAARDIDPHDRDALIADLVAQEPEWAPGTVPAEHALTYGHLIDGALAAVGAADVRTAAADVAARLGAELWFGVPESALARVADLEIIDPEWVSPYLERDLAARATNVPAGMIDPRHTNSREARLASFPAVGLFTTATSLARFYDDLPRTDGVIAGLLGPELVEAYTTAQVTGVDRFLESEAEWSLGMRVDGGELGMGGLGGSCGWYSPGLDYAFGFVTRGLGTFDRVDVLADAVEAAIRGE